jgi:hypothetical protein
VPLAAELADAAGGQAVLAGQVLRPLADRHLLGDGATPPVERPDTGRPPTFSTAALGARLAVGNNTQTNYTEVTRVFPVGRFFKPSGRITNPSYKKQPKAGSIILQRYGNFSFSRKSCTLPSG